MNALNGTGLASLPPKAATIWGRRLSCGDVLPGMESNHRRLS
jgi:hypothetical protein